MKYEGIPKLVQALQLMNSILVYVGDFFHPLNILFNKVNLLFQLSFPSRPAPKTALLIVPSSDTGTRSQRSTSASPGKDESSLW